MNLDELSALLHEHDDGVLRHGKHSEGREFCALEFESKVRGRDWSDRPVTLPDIRPLNDACWSSDAARTAGLLPVMVALWDWAMWTEDRRVAWARYVALETVRQIVAELPGLAESVRTQCRTADYLGAAAAARAAAAAAARAAAAAAAWAAADKVLLTACAIWIAGVEATK